MLSNLEVKRLSPTAILPTRKHAADAGYDLYYDGEDVTVFASRKKLKTGIAVNIPEGYVAMVCSRSGLANDYGVRVINAPGIIDSGFQGEIQVILEASEPVKIERGMRIAQLVITPIETPELVEVEVLSESGSARGTGGFGSTGLYAVKEVA